MFWFIWFGLVFIVLAVHFLKEAVDPSEPDDDDKSSFDSFPMNDNYPMSWLFSSSSIFDDSDFDYSDFDDSE